MSAMADMPLIAAAEAERTLSRASMEHDAVSRPDSIEKKDDKNQAGFVVVDKADIDNRHLIDPSYPSPEQRRTLRRIPGSIDAKIFSVGLIEFAERFSYYGSTVVFTNFIQQPLPAGSTTGAIKGLAGANTPGALGKGQQAAFGITTFNSFWIYVCPIFGAIVADMYWGRFKTISVAVGIALFGHVLLVVSGIPSVIANTQASYAVLIISIIISGVGTGAFKSSISPLIAEQTPHKELTLKTLKSGETVIIDPTMTVSRIMLYFYMLVNCGALSGQIGMVYAEQDVGFWLSYLLPLIVLCLAPFVLLWGRKRYVLTPPNGSVFLSAMRLIRLAWAKSWSSNPAQLKRNIASPEFWQQVKPSRYENNPEGKPSWMTFDDLWVDQVRRGLKACQVFILIPIYWLCYNQMTGNLTSQAATMTRNVPNDLINNLNPISLVIFIPIMDQVVYPFLRKKKINFTPVKRITCGFFLASLSMLVSALVQHYIYKTSPCGSQAATCDEFSPLNVWIQTPSYVLIGISEIFTSITGLEYAFTKAPENMRTFVTSMWLFTNAFSAALGQAFVALSTDPLLVWNYSVFCVLSFIAGILFWILFRKLDSEEHELNDMRYYKGADAHGKDSVAAVAPGPATAVPVSAKYEN